MRLRMRHLSFEQKMKIHVLHSTIKKSYREIEEILSIPKSTIHDNIAYINEEIQVIGKSYDLDRSRLLVFIVLVLAMEGQASSRRIETILHKIWNESISHQTILKILVHSATVAAGFNSNTDLQNIKNLLLDEIHQKNMPVLGMCDSFSALINLSSLGDRTGESWETFLNKLENQGLLPYSVTSDGGTGLLKGLSSVFKSIVLSRDIFHVLYKLSKAHRNMLARCYSLIIATDKTSDLDKKSELKEKTDLAIDIFDRFEIALKRFSTSWRIGSEEGLQFITSDELGVALDKVNIELSNYIKNIGESKSIKDAFTYLTNGREEILSHKKTIENMVVKRFGSFTKHVVLDHLMSLVESIEMYSRAYENKKLKDFYGRKISVLRKSLRSYQPADQNEVDNAINKCMEIVQHVNPSSSMIECVNSVIRSHLNTYKSIPSWFCDLFTFFWNHRKFSRGKREGFAPIELLKGKKLEKEWVDILVESYPYEKLRSGLPTQACYTESVYQKAS